MASLERKCSRAARELQPRVVRLRQVLAALVLLLSPLPAQADPYDRLAAQLAEAGAKQGRRRVAVLPFNALTGHDAAAGRVVGERLVGRLAGRAELEVVERTLLRSVLEEQKLAATGAISPETVKELGQILGVDALVAGTVLGLKNDRIEVNARLIDARTARVLSAATQTVEREWTESVVDSWALPVPPLPGYEILPTAWAGPGLGEDSLCDGWEDQLSAIDRSSVDLKARFWARRLREGLRLDSLKANPGSEIRDLEVRAEFYARLKQRHAEDSPLSLTAEDLERLRGTEKKRRRLLSACAAEGA